MRLLYVCYILVNFETNIKTKDTYIIHIPISLWISDLWFFISAFKVKTWEVC